MEPESDRLQELLDEIESLRIGESWSLPLDLALGLIHSEREEYYRYIYSLRRKGGGWSENLRDEFGPENTRELVGFLEHQGFADATARFLAAGLYFEEDRLLDWLEFFQSVSLSRIQSQSVERDLLESAIAGCMRFSDAADFYCHVKFDQTEYGRFAVSLYLKRIGAADHHLSRAILGAYLAEQFRHRRIIWEDLCRGAHELLRVKAREWGVYEEEPERRQYNVALLAPEMRDALQELELPLDRLPAAEELKTRYRNLLKQYHPDVNPEGQDRTRRIVAAYSVVYTEVKPAEV